MLCWDLHYDHVHDQRATSEEFSKLSKRSVASDINRQTPFEPPPGVLSHDPANFIISKRVDERMTIDIVPSIEALRERTTAQLSWRKYRGAEARSGTDSGRSSGKRAFMQQSASETQPCVRRRYHLQVRKAFPLSINE